MLAEMDQMCRLFPTYQGQFPEKKVVVYYLVIKIEKCREKVTSVEITFFSTDPPQ